jgi:acetyl esterase
MPTRTDLDPEIERAVAAFEERAIPEWHATSVECARRLEGEAFEPGDPPLLDLVRDLAIPGPDVRSSDAAGGRVPIRVYRPDVDRPMPVLLFFHGGGWVLGTLDSADGICRRLADRGAVMVISVDYRLAPEHPFPAALEDAWSALRWVEANAPALGGDRLEIGVGGTSAGGNLAAATAIRSRAFEGPDVTRQLLAYPITNHAFDTDSYRENANGPLLTRADMEWFWGQYLRSPVDSHNPFASPLRAPPALLDGLAPATVLTAGFDPLRDEGRAYAERLAEAGVTIDHCHYPDLPHGFLSFAEESDRADGAMSEAARSLRSSI